MSFLYGVHRHPLNGQICLCNLHLASTAQQDNVINRVSSMRNCIAFFVQSYEVYHRMGLAGLYAPFLMVAVWNETLHANHNNSMEIRTTLRADQATVYILATTNRPGLYIECVARMVKSKHVHR